MKKIMLATLTALVCMVSFAQSGTNSPYSQYGLGVMSEQGNGHVRGMNGVGVAFHDHDGVNFLNPASYAQYDSVSFFFDAGLSLQVTNFSENGRKLNANNANFEYAMAGMRLVRNLGMTFGIVPLTNVGYNYSSTKNLDNYSPVGTSESYTSMTAYSGNGGIREFFLGLGWKTPFKGPVNVALGLNGGYVWGTTNKLVQNTYSDSYVNTLSKTYTSSVASYDMTLGAQVIAKVSKLDELTLGATYRPGHSLGADPTLEIISTNSANNVADTTTLVASDGLEMPAKLTVGVAYRHSNKWRAGFDYSLEKWSSVVYPTTIVGNTHAPIPGVEGSSYQYRPVKGLFSDREKFNVGAEYCYNELGRSFISRIRYRLGASYATPYLKINGKDGPSEYAVSFGLGIPILTGYSSSARHYSVANISAQWVRTSMPNAITENTFRINVGLTFNERWFAKWQFE